MDTTDQEDKESVGRIPETSLGGFKCKASLFNIRDAHTSTGPAGVFPQIKYSIDFQQCGTMVYDNTPRRASYFLPHENYNGLPFYQHDYSSWPVSHPDFQKFEQAHWASLDNHFYPVHIGYPSLPIRLYLPNCPQGFNTQEFQYFVVVDFEATCDKERNPQPQEIIEFPSVLVNSMNGQIEASFQTYVRPMYNQNLTDFCKELTGIQQIQVDRGVPLAEAIYMHDRWLEDKGIKSCNFAIVTWSSWDCRVMLDSECRLKKIRKPPYFNRWINLKVPFKEAFGGARCNLKEAVTLAGLEWEGRPHCGLDDARNTARLLAHLMRRGSRLSITDSMWLDQSALPPSPARPNQKLLPQAAPFHPSVSITHCFCGVTSSKRMVRKPGPKHGRFFFGCGNWTSNRGAVCPYFEWASS